MYSPIGGVAGSAPAEKPAESRRWLKPKVPQEQLYGDRGRPHYFHLRRGLALCSATNAREWRGIQVAVAGPAALAQQSVLALAWLETPVRPISILQAAKDALCCWPELSGN